MVSADFNHRSLVASIQRQQSQRHAQVVIQIAARGQYPPASRQNAANQFFGGGLAIATRHRHHRTAKARPMGSSGLL